MKGSFWHWDCQKIDTNVPYVSFPSVRNGGEEAACSCSRRDGNRPEVRWSIKSCSISPLWPSPSSHRSSKSFLKLTCSCWHVVLIQWFHNWPGFSRGDAYRGEEHADSWSGVSLDREWICVRCCKTYEEAVSLMFLRCDVSAFRHLKGVVLYVSGLGLMQISCWRASGVIFFGQSTLSDRSASSWARFLLLSVAFCSE